MDQFFRKLTTNASKDNFITCRESFLKLIPRPYLGKIALFVITDAINSKSRLYSWIDRNKLALFKITIIEYKDLDENIIKYTNWYNTVIIDSRDIKYIEFIKNIFTLDGLINKNIRFVFLSNLLKHLPPFLRNRRSNLLYRNWKYIDMQLKRSLPSRSSNKTVKTTKRFEPDGEEESYEQVL